MNFSSKNAIFTFTTYIMTTKLVYTGGLHTEAVHIRSGNTLETDAPVDNQGKGETFSPTDLMAVSLGSCILTIMGIAARKHGINIEGTTCDVSKKMASKPRRIARLEVNLQMPNRPYSAEEKEVLDYAARNTPVSRSLHPDLEEVIVIEW